MSSPTFVVLPATGDTVQRSDKETAEIASTIQNALHERQHPKVEQPGPIKQILAHQDSLYEYINWESPTRTLGCYIGTLGILFGTHYLPLTKVVLKAVVTALGVVSISEFTSRLVSGNSLSARLRPKEYKKFPESTLNATLKDVHDLSQYAVIQVQRIVFGQDLDKTFTAFLGFIALYWLAKIATPFWLTVLTLTLIFLAPLIHSRFGRQIGHEAQELANVAVNMSQELAQNGKSKAVEISGHTQELANAAIHKGQELAQNGKSRAVDIPGQTQELANVAVHRGQELAESGKSKAIDLSVHTKNAATSLSGGVAETVNQVPQTPSDKKINGQNELHRPQKNDLSAPILADSEKVE